MDNLVNQGFELAMFGMGTVFAFLALLILATKAMSALVLRFQPATDAATADTVTHFAALANRQQLIAVISAAIAQHRSKNK